MSVSEDAEHEAQFRSLQSVDRVVANPVHFKLALGIGEDSYATLRYKRLIGDIWGVGGGALTGAKFAATSSAVASYFSSGGLLSLVGLGAATTPIGWIIAAACVSGGAYYGVGSLVRNYTASRVDVLPRFINTPLDVLGIQLFDLIAPLAMHVAHADGSFHSAEREAVGEYFIEHWGLDPDYIASALPIIEENFGARELDALLDNLSDFIRANPDCNSGSITRELIRMLTDVVEADMKVDPREEEALRGIETALTARYGAGLRGAAGVATRMVAGSVSGAVERLRGRFRRT